MRTLRLGFVIVLLLLAARSFAEPEVFSDAGFEADKAFAVENNKLHVIYFTAIWCPPCQKMKKTTWVDKSLVSWLGEHAVVSSVDVDDERELAEKYAISAMPTIIVTNEGEEVGRTVGYQGAANFRDWLIKAQSGELPPHVQQTPEEIYNEAFESARETGRQIREFQDRLESARETMNRGSDSYQRATEQYLTIIEELVEHGYVELFDEYRTSVWLLVDEYPPARKSFAAARDQIESDLRAGQVNWDKLSGWAVLNYILDDQNRTLNWLERRVAAGSGVPSSRLIYDIAHEAAINARRFDLLKEIADPLYESLTADAEFEHLTSVFQATGRLNELDEQDSKQILENMLELRRYTLAEQHAIALGIGDIDAAARIREMLLNKDDTEEARRLLTEYAQGMGVDAGEEAD
ncbi:MAG: hypothetical protein ED559_00700 [Phycisphaera sp.]|nr:MAG: hypothetical protein ED559_00700 [Phycisphaera sp.]